MDPQELVPLEAGILKQPRQQAPRNCGLASRSCFRAPLRICRLLVLLIVLPTMFITIPLYMRYRVFLGQMYPMSMTDMRLIDSKISTTWCQRQVVRSNATFNAFVVPGAPELSQDLVPVSMTRELELEDDMKEYWGFYLLKGSSVTVSACVSYPGASLIMIKGYKHLQECAYIGDDSSEEVEELVEAYNLGLLTNTSYVEKIQAIRLRKVDGKANDPDTMRRHKAGVSFHDPTNAVNATSSDNFPTDFDITDHDPKELQVILERLHALRQTAKTESLKYYHPPEHLMSLPALHRHRDANVDKEERRFLSFKDIDGINSDAVTKETPQRKATPKTIPIHKGNNSVKDDDSAITNNTPLKKFSTPKANTKSTLNIPDINDFESTNKYDNPVKHNNFSENNSKFNKHKTKAKDVKEDNNREVNQEKEENQDTTLRKVKKEEVKKEKDFLALKEMDTEYTSLTPEPNSKEVFDEVLQKLQALGDRGKRVLLKLHDTMGVEYQEKTSIQSQTTAMMSKVLGTSEELDHLRRVLLEAIEEEQTRGHRQQKRKESMQDARAKRELMLGQIELTKELNEDDEARDYAAEEGLEPDGFAEHHMTVNETTALDMSNSEFWSSFSSSEEALLECDGLILNLPLTPNAGCHKEASGEESFRAARANALTYRVPANGYYFFVFNSENEVQTNFIRAKFDLQKTRYDIARTTLRRCTNSTDSCHLPLDIFTSQKVVLEVPLRDNDSLWNEQFVIISECEPRTSIYLFCVIAVPILIMIFAFQ